jgi:hypothetical protein
LQPTAKRVKHSYSGRNRQITKDVVCLPPSTRDIESIPSGNYRGKLAAKGKHLSVVLYIITGQCLNFDFIVSIDWDTGVERFVFPFMTIHISSYNRC